MVVGAGIGVTPFASILRSVQLRTQQRQALLSKAPTTSQWRSAFAAKATNDTVSAENLLQDVITVPKKLYFYWVVRSQEEFDWFYDLLAAATDGPARSIIEIYVFMTGEIELAAVKKLPCVTSQCFGRPQWGRIFKQNRDLHKGDHIGVFLCGSPQIGVELARQSSKHTDAPGLAGGTRFSFFKENF